jgi:hypothetical protein
VGDAYVVEFLQESRELRLAGEDGSEQIYDAATAASARRFIVPCRY